MALPNPTMDFTPFDILTAEELDQIVENIESLADGSGISNGVISNAQLKTGSGEPGGAWQTFTPTWTGGSPSIGNGTIQGYWKQVGKTVHFRVNLTAGGTTTFGSSSWFFTLPTAAASTVTAKTAIGTIFIEKPGTADYGGIVAIDTSTTFQIWYFVGGSINPVSNTSPATWNSTSFFRFSGTYEAA